MKKIILLFVLIILSAFTNYAQTINCGSFCVLSIGNVDTIAHELDVAIYNGDTNSVNYPSVVVVNSIGDTIANIGNDYYLFAQLAGDTVVHTIPCDTLLDSISSGFLGMVYITDNLWNITCGYPVPMTCTVGINELASNSNFTMYPNPTKDNVTLSVSAILKHEAEIQIYDATGQEVKKYTTSNSQLTIHRENLINGLYFVSIEINGKRYTKKLVIQ